MAGLLKSLPPRSTRQSDADVLQRTSKTQIVSPTIKGGDSLLGRINTIIALVETKLGKYKDDYTVLRDGQGVIDYFESIIQQGIGAIDTETTSLDPLTCTMAGVCLYAPGLKPAYIPVNHTSYITGVKVSNQISPELIRDCLRKCRDAGVKWIMHNAAFDTRVLWHAVGVMLKCYWDTQWAARCISNLDSYGLKNQHLKYCDSKDTEVLSYEKLFEGIPFTLIPVMTAYLYAAGDGVKTFEVYEYQRKVLNRRNLPGPYEVFWNIEMPLIPAVAEMEDVGIAFDCEYNKELSVKYNAIMEEQKKAIYDVLAMYDSDIQMYKQKTPGHCLSDPIGIGSPKQLAVVFYDIMGMVSPDKKKPRGTGEEIISTFDNPLAKAILAYRTTSKLISTYIDKMPHVLNPNDGRVHCKYNQYGADTGRFSSSDPNMQNIPSKNHDIRPMFVATEGYVMISCDFSQQEPRTLAHMSRDHELIQAYADGKDIYAWIAASIYNVPYDKCREFRPDGTKNEAGKKRRDSVKSIILGIMYGRGAKAIAEQIGSTTKKAQQIIDKFFESFPQVAEFIQKVQDKARTTGYVETAWGRRRYIPDMLLKPYEFSWLEGYAPQSFDPLAFDQVESNLEVPEEERNYFTKRLKNCYKAKDRSAIMAEARAKGLRIIDNTGKIADAERQCVNSIIQGSAADMSKLAMIAIYNDPQLREWGYRMLIPVHDEIIGECPEENAKKCADRVCELMVKAANSKISVPMKVDAEITTKWYGKEVEIPEEEEVA